MREALFFRRSSEVVIGLPASRRATLRMAASTDRPRPPGTETGRGGGEGPVNVPFLLPLTKYLPSASLPPDLWLLRRVADRPFMPTEQAEHSRSSVREGIALAPKVEELSWFPLRLGIAS